MHFAVDPDLIYMTTRLSGESTFFRPFNRGHDGGAGNPAHPSGYRSGYLWEEVWERHSFLGVVGRYMHLQREQRWVDGQKQTKEMLLFPRFHQLDAVRKLTEVARTEGPGQSHLIQHSAGSGKTRSGAKRRNPRTMRLFDHMVRPPPLAVQQIRVPGALQARGRDQRYQPATTASQLWRDDE